MVTVRDHSILEAWQRAETSLGRSRAARRAADNLPPRLGWILLALDALERGVRLEISDLAREAGDAGALEVGWILEILCGTPAELDPTRVRKQAKRDGVGENSRLPVLDLLRMWTAWRRGETGYLPPAVSRAARVRPVLRHLVPLLQDKNAVPPFPAIGGRGAEGSKLLAALSKRIAGLWLACYARREEHDDIRWLLREYLPESPVKFPPARWPDLEEIEPRAELDAWLAHPTVDEWNDGLLESIKAVERAPIERRRYVLGRLLACVQAGLGSGRPLRMLPIVRVAHMVAGWVDRRRVPGPALQLLMTEMRLEWFKPGASRSLELLELLWNQLRQRPLAERRVVAREVLHLPADALEPAVRREMETCLVCAETCPRTAEIWLEHFGPRLRERDLERGLREAVDAEAMHQGEAEEMQPEIRCRHILGFHALARGKPRDALAAVEWLVECGRPVASEIGVRLLSSILHANGRGLGGKAGTRALERALGSCARGQLDGRAAALILHPLQDVIDKQRFERYRTELRPAIEQALVAPGTSVWSADVLRTPDVAYLLLGWELIGEGKRAEEVFRELGRFLRRHRGEGGNGQGDVVRVDELALRVVMRLIITGALRVGRQGPRRWIEVLNAFLLRDGPGQLARRVGALDVAGLVDADEMPGLGAWFLLYGDDLCGEMADWEKVFLTAGRLYRQVSGWSLHGFLESTVALVPTVPSTGTLERFIMSSIASALGDRDLRSLIDITGVDPEEFIAGIIDRIVQRGGGTIDDETGFEEGEATFEEDEAALEKDEAALEKDEAALEEDEAALEEDGIPF